MSRTAGRQPEAAVLIATLVNLINRLEHRPPVTLALVALNLLVHFGLVPFPSISDACLQPEAMVQRGQWLRLLWAPLVHVTDVHLLANVSSLLWKGSQLEPALGSARFAALLVELAACSGLLYVGAAWAAARLASPTAAAAAAAQLYGGTCAAGLSAVLFGLKVVSHARHDQPAWSSVGGFQLPTKYIAWAELAYVQLLAPGSSFLGHVAGLAAGMLHVAVAGALTGRGSGSTRWGHRSPVWRSNGGRSLAQHQHHRPNRREDVFVAADGTLHRRAPRSGLLALGAGLAAASLVLLAAATNPGVDSFVAYACDAARHGSRSLAALASTPPSLHQQLLQSGQLSCASWWLCSFARFRRSPPFWGAFGGWVPVPLEWASWHVAAPIIGGSSKSSSNSPQHHGTPSAAEVLLLGIAAGPLLHRLAPSPRLPPTRPPGGPARGRRRAAPPVGAAARWVAAAVAGAFAWPLSALPSAVFNLQLLLRATPALEECLQHNNDSESSSGSNFRSFALVPPTLVVLGAYLVSSMLAQAAQQWWDASNSARSWRHGHTAAASLPCSAGVVCLLALEWLLEGGWRQWPWAGGATLTPAALLGGKLAWDAAWSALLERRWPPPLWPAAAGFSVALAVACTRPEAGGGALQLLLARLQQAAEGLT